MRIDRVVFCLAASAVLACSAPLPAAGPYQATGFKVGEVSDTTAIVWTRLTLRPERNPADGPSVSIRYAPGAESRRSQRVAAIVYDPPGATPADLRDAVPGAAGQTRVLYRPAGEKAWRETAWQAVDPDRDFTCQFRLTGLRPNTRYAVRVQGRSGPDSPLGQELDGSFRTAPAPDDPARIVFTVSTGQAYGDRDCPEGYKIYAQMLKLDPSFFVHTGDIVYYDRLAKTPALARYHWQRTYSLPSNVAFHRRVASYFIKDDHDTWQNDCWPTMKSEYMGEFTFQQGQAIFREQVPMGERTYRTRRWGKDLQIWLMEGRDYRSPNHAPDGPDKTIWGAEQKAWLQRTLNASDAAFRVVISPTPIVGPDRDNKHDNHANRDFQYEGAWVRSLLGGMNNVVVVCGDRHWQYMSVDPATGLREYSCGPASDEHAGGWKQDDFRPAYHRYLNVIGGFLSATVERTNGTPSLTFRYHDVEGRVRFEHRITAR